MILRLLSCLEIILISRTVNIITWKAYLRNSCYKYELASNLATRSINQNIHLGFSYNSIQNVVRVLPTFPIGFLDSIQVGPSE